MNKLILLLFFLMANSCYNVEVKEHPIVREVKRDSSINIKRRPPGSYNSKYPELAYEILLLKRLEIAIKEEIDIQNAPDSFLDLFEYSTANDTVLKEIDYQIDQIINLVTSQIKI